MKICTVLFACHALSARAGGLRSVIPDDVGQAYLYLSQLRNWLGDAFLSWVLGGEAVPPTPAQQEVVIVLFRACSPFAGQLDLSTVDFLVSNRGRPGRELLAELKLGTSGFEVSRPPGSDAGHASSILNALCSHAGGGVPAVPPPTGDAVVDSLRTLAVEVYGSLLLPEGTACLSRPILSSSVSATERHVMEAIRADPGLPFNAGSGDGDWVSLMTSTGRAHGVALAYLGPSLVGHAWDLARLREAHPSAEVFLREIPSAVAAARTAFTGTKIVATGLVSFGGVLLPAGSEPAFTWRQLRPVREGDHPREVQGPLDGRRCTQPRDNGTRAVFTDGGDVMLAAAVPFTVRAEEYDPARGFPDLSGIRELETRILQVRLALLLAWPDPQPPALLGRALHRAACPRRRLLMA